jgi:hypothetical protein
MDTVISTQMISTGYQAIRHTNKHRPRADRQALFANAFAETESWVISGSVCGWGDPFLSRFELVVFLVVPVEERLVRLRAREIIRYGHEAIALVVGSTRPTSSFWTGRDVTTTEGWTCEAVLFMNGGFRGYHCPCFVWMAIRG